MGQEELKSGNGVPGKTETALGPFFILAAACLWGTSGVAQALAPQAATPYLLGTIRIIGGWVLLSLVALLRGQFADFSRFLKPVFLLTGLTQALFNFSYFTCLSLMGVAVGTMVEIGSTPIFAGILGILLNRDRVGLRWYSATAIAITGLVLLVGEQSSLDADPLGLVFALLAGFSYSFFSFVSGRLIRSGYEPESVMAVSFFVAGIVMSPVFALTPVSWILEPAGVWAALYLGLISCGLSYLFYGRGLRTVILSHVGTLTLAEPLTAAALGIFFLGEPVSAMGILGMVLILLAQVLIVTAGRRRASAGAKS